MKMTINWEQYKEEEIQTIIEILYTSLGYHTQNLHKADRSHENGADLVMEKDDEKIAIAVKIKPINNDRPQVLDLSKRPENKKIYLYISTPSAIFKEFMNEFKDKIDFWDAKKLNDFFKENHPFFMANIIFNKSEINHELEKICFLLWELRNKCSNLKKEPINKLDANSYLSLWRLKDTAVTLHKTNEIISTLFEEPMNFKNNEFNEHFIEIFLDYLKIMHQNFNLFNKHFNDFYINNKSLVRNGILRGFTTSHWFWLNLNTLSNISGLESALKKSKDDQKLNEKIRSRLTTRQINEFKKDLEIESQGNDVWKAMDFQIKRMSQIGHALEIIIDDIMAEYLDKDVHLFSLENQDLSKLLD